MGVNLLDRYIRRRVNRLSLFAAFSLSMVGMLLGGSPASAADQLSAVTGPGFVARDATRFPGNPDLSSYGLKNIEVVYQNSLWPAGASKTQPDTAHILKYYIPKIKDKNLDVLVIDIEVWPFKSGMTATEVTANIAKFKKVIDVFRREVPTVKLGLYLVLPERNWLAPCGDPKKIASRTASWHQRNLQLQPLADAVDIIVPSLYTFYGDAKSIACWPKYANANIAEARIYGKPVWAFLWMKYKSNGTLIPASFWRQQLETVYTIADGLAIWSKASGSEPWSWTAPWWVETAAFLEAKGLAN